ETNWDPVTERFGVALREGAITVSGPVVGDARAVRAGERLSVSPATNTLEVGSIDSTLAPAPSAPAPSAAPPAPSAPLGPGGLASEPLGPGGLASEPLTTPHAPDAEAASPRGQTSADGPASSAPASHDSPGWRALALDAKYKDALAAAEREGFDAICGAT